MDSTREGDLKRLYTVFSDPLLPLGQRRVAYRSFEKILRQMKDKTLNSLRHRLARATVAGDADVSEKLTMKLQEYTQRKGY